MSEYFRLVNDIKVQNRATKIRESGKSREITPPNVKGILGDIYKGRCQVCDFWFLKKDGNPYLEIHHINPRRGHDLKNLLIVCANCHRQFEFANTGLFFNPEEWLIEVKFNENFFAVNHIYLKTDTKEFFKHIHTSD